MPRRKKSGVKKSGTVAPSAAAPMTVGVTQARTRTLLKLAVSQASSLRLTHVDWYVLGTNSRSHPALANWSQGRIIRAGLEIGPGHYAEFLVRGEQVAELNTRTELVLQQDVQVHYSIDPGLKRYWYKPVEADFMTFQELDQGLRSGLFLAITGMPTLANDPTDFIGSMVLEVELIGFNNISLTRMNTAIASAVAIDEHSDGSDVSL